MKLLDSAPITTSQRAALYQPGVQAILLTCPLQVLPGYSCAHAEVACGGHAETITELGHLVWPKLAAAYIERRLAPAAPRDEAGLDAFQGMAKAAERFEGDAAATGCGPPTPSTHTS